jgi:hypothetical protein
MKKNRLFLSIKLPKICLLALGLGWASLALAQPPAARTDSDPASDVAKATDLSIPISPALTLLGVNPSLVARPSFTRDIKVDWSFTSYRVSPNLALEAQPIWLLFYDRPDLTRYRQAGAFLRTLSTLSLSLATIQRGTDEQRQLAFAVKLNLFRARDPLMEVEQFKRSFADYYAQREELLKQQREWEDTLQQKTDPVDKLNAQDEIDKLESELVRLKVQQKERNLELKAQYQRAFWNASCLDVAFGRIYNYNSDTFDSLRLQSSGLGAWINGGLRLGRHGFLSGQVQYLAQEVLNPDNRVVGTRATVSAGLNFRYGSPRYNFFVEAMRDHVLENGPQVRTFTLAYGGDLRLGGSVLLGYGIRNVITDDLTLRNLIPMASVTCLMR